MLLWTKKACEREDHFLWLIVDCNIFNIFKNLSFGFPFNPPPAITFHLTRNTEDNNLTIFYFLPSQSKEYLEKNQLDYRFYRPYYYLASIAFLE